MKKIYTAPEVDISRFSLAADILSASSGDLESNLAEKSEDVVFYGFGRDSGFGF